MKTYRIAKLAYDYSRNRISPLAMDMSKEEVLEYIAMQIEQFAKQAYLKGREDEQYSYIDLLNADDRFDLWLNGQK